MPISISPDLITGIIGFLFTLLIFSYVLGDNPLFRVAVYIFVGVSSGYIATVAWWQVIMPRLISPLTSEVSSFSAISSGNIWQKILMLMPLIGALLILMKASPSMAGMGRIPMAFMVGVGAAVTIAGALIGTLIPQVLGTINAFDLNAASARNIDIVEATFNAAIILTGTVLTLAYFHFGARPKVDGSMHRLGLIEALAWGGRLFIGIALGAVFAGVYSAALTALIERISWLINFIFGLFGNLL